MKPIILATSKDHRNRRFRVRLELHRRFSNLEYESSIPRYPLQWRYFQMGCFKGRHHERDVSGKYIQW